MSSAASILTNPRERTRFLRFLIVGGVGSVVDFGLSNLLIQVFKTPLVVAGTISFIAAVLSNFTLNRIWTYSDSRSKSVRRQFGQFALVSIIGLAIRVPALAILEPIMYRFVLRLPIEWSISPKVIADNLTLAMTISIVLMWNFFANRYWTYSDIE